MGETKCSGRPIAFSALGPERLWISSIFDDSVKSLQMKLDFEVADTKNHISDVVCCNTV